MAHIEKDKKVVCVREPIPEHDAEHGDGRRDVDALAIRIPREIKGKAVKLAAEFAVVKALGKSERDGAEAGERVALEAMHPREPLVMGEHAHRRAAHEVRDD